MRWGLALFLAAHGVAHVVGFAINWRLLTSAEIPFKTTVLSGWIDLGERGVKVEGLLWLIAAGAFIVAAAGVALRLSSAPTILTAAVAFSTLLCAASLPEARMGLRVNLGLAAGLALAWRFAWWL